MKASNLKFSDPVLKEYHIEINDEFLESVSSDEAIEMPKVEYEVNCSDVSDNEFFIVGKLTIGEQNKNSPFYAYITMGARFYCKNKFNEKELELYKSIHAPAHLVSYMRPIMAMITSMTPFPAYHIPFFNFKENTKHSQ